MTCTKMAHSSHEHELIKLINRTPYECNGCKEPGWGTRYSCDEKCDYHLHEDCASHSKTLSHDFFKTGTSFKFLERAPGPHIRYCRACGKEVQGYVYHCHKTGDDLHPVCANLPLVSQQDGVEAHLNKKISKKCGNCGRRGTMVRSNNRAASFNKVKCWSYKYSNTNEEYHLACLIEIMVKNLKNGNYPEPERNSLAMEITNVPNFHLAVVSAGTSRQLSNWKKTKTFANLLVTYIFGGHTAGITNLAASMLSK